MPVYRLYGRYPVPFEVEYESKSSVIISRHRYPQKK